MIVADYRNSHTSAGVVWDLKYANRRETMPKQHNIYNMPCTMCSFSVLLNRYVSCGYHQLDRSRSPKMHCIALVIETELTMKKCNYPHTLGGLWVHTLCIYLCLSTQECCFQSHQSRWLSPKLLIKRFLTCQEKPQTQLMDLLLP